MKTSSARIIALAFIFIAAYHASAYTPPSEQILQTTAKVNRHITTVEGILKTTLFDERFDEGRLEITEHIYMKGIGCFRSERHTPSGNDVIIQNGRKTVAKIHDLSNVNIRRIETVFPLIYFHNSIETLMDDLHYLGIDTRIVAFDKVNETVAYAVGTGNTDNPGSKLWIDKNRGLPIKFIGISTVEGKRITLRADYLDYTRVKQRFWLPTRIDYYINDLLQATCILEKVSINQPIADTLFEIPEDGDSYIPLAHFLTMQE